MLRSLAEREGFEPSIRFWRILTFQASAFDHSATAPQCSGTRGPTGCASLRQGRAKRLGKRHGAWHQSAMLKSLIALLALAAAVPAAVPAFAQTTPSPSDAAPEDWHAIPD